MSMHRWAARISICIVAVCWVKNCCLIVKGDGAVEGLVTGVALADGCCAKGLETAKIVIRIAPMLVTNAFMELPFVRATVEEFPYVAPEQPY